MSFKYLLLLLPSVALAAPFNMNQAIGESVKLKVTGASSKVNLRKRQTAPFVVRQSQFCMGSVCITANDLQRLKNLPNILTTKVVDFGFVSPTCFDV